MLVGGGTLLDIGTDHAYLPTACVSNGLFERAIVSDINDGPLEKAKATIEAAGLRGLITPVLSDGFLSLPEGCADEIVIAGMGGILICEILAQADWIKDSSVHLVLQPMTHAEDVRGFLVENGFLIEAEAACVEGGKPYCVISAKYCGEKEAHEDGYFYYGELKSSFDAETGKYLKKVFASVNKKLNGLKLSGGDEAEIIRLERVRNDFIENTEVDHDEG